MSQSVPRPQVVGIKAQSLPAQILGLVVASGLLQGEGVLPGHESPPWFASPSLHSMGAGSQPAVEVPDMQRDVVSEAHGRKVPLAQGDLVPGPDRAGELPGEHEFERSQMGPLALC